MVDPGRAQDPSLRKEYWKLISTACNHCHLFDAAQKAQLEVYQIWAVLLNEIQTDDNFAFNKVLKKIQVSKLMHFCSLRQGCLWREKTIFVEEPCNVWLTRLHDVSV